MWGELQDFKQLKGFALFPQCACLCFTAAEHIAQWEFGRWRHEEVQDAEQRQRQYLFMRVFTLIKWSNVAEDSMRQKIKHKSRFLVRLSVPVWEHNCAWRETIDYLIDSWREAKDFNNSISICTSHIQVHVRLRHKHVILNAAYVFSECLVWLQNSLTRPMIDFAIVCWLLTLIAMAKSFCFVLFNHVD